MMVRSGASCASAHCGGGLAAATPPRTSPAPGQGGAIHGATHRS
jgi:hypothetical protein